jgi:hypothetical protein
MRRNIIGAPRSRMLAPIDNCPGGHVADAHERQASAYGRVRRLRSSYTAVRSDRLRPPGGMTSGHQHHRSRQDDHRCTERLLEALAGPCWSQAWGSHASDRCRTRHNALQTGPAAWRGRPPRPQIGRSWQPGPPTSGSAAKQGNRLPKNAAAESALPPDHGWLTPGIRFPRIPRIGCRAQRLCESAPREPP